MVLFKRACFFYFFTAFVFFHSSLSHAQVKKHFVYFTDKTGSPYSTSNPSQYLSPRSIQRRVKQGIEITSRDLPVNSAYVDSVKNKGATLWYTSRWFNAVMVMADSSQMVSIKALPFVQKTSVLNRLGSPSFENGSQSADKLLLTPVSTPDYGSSLNQIAMIGADVMHAQGFHGEGIEIAVLDGGFNNANSLPIFNSLFNNNQILATYDFVSRDLNVYDDDPHGTAVLSALAGYSSGQLVGTAYKAKFYLLRTEDTGSEYLMEEVNWLMGAEYADSAGADIISSSLGYNTFDDPATNHTYDDLDGNTTIVTKAANMAASAGIIVVNSAGNEGSHPWKYINVPADSDSILSIAAVDAYRNHASFSSFGPSADGRIKPDLAAQGQGTILGSESNSIFAGNGTSFSCPLVAGLAAGVWQAYPDLTSLQVIDLLKKSGSQACHPDNILGFGIPDFRRLQILIGFSNDNKTTIYPSLFGDENLSLLLTSPDIGKNVTVKLIDLQGRLLDEQYIEKACLDNKLGFDPSGLSPGVYLIHVLSETQRQTIKVVKF